MSEHVEIDAIDSLHSVVVELERLQSALNGTELDTFKYFNGVYVFVAQELENTVAKNVFSDRALIEKLDIEFSLHYFRALNAFAEHHRLPELWDALTKPGICRPYYFLLGANIHINHDLPLALMQTVSDFDAFKRDFDLADHVLSQAIKKFFMTYKPTGFSAPAKKILAWMLSWPIIWIILDWRHRAWRNAQLISEGKLTKQQLIQRTARASSILVSFGRFFCPIFAMLGE